MLDSGCIASFPALCAMSVRNAARLARFMYCVSCSAELVARLVFEHGCVKVVAAVLEPRAADDGVEGGGGGGGGERDSSIDDARETCAALLFNLSTQV